MTGWEVAFDNEHVVETLRVEEAERIGARLAQQFASGEIGVYRLLCEIRKN